MFGFPVPADLKSEKGEPVRYWGARALLRDGAFELLHDRTSVQLQPEDEAIIAKAGGDSNALMFIGRINDTFLPWLRNEAVRLDGRSSEVVTYSKYGYTLMASPKNSYGYLYIGVWEFQRPKATYDMPIPDTSAKWSGKAPVPAIGEEVKVTMNSMGKGQVMSYFVEEGYLGCYVKLAKPPAWFKKQNKTPYACIFGVDLG